MMYNCCSWSPTAKSLETLDLCHRKHLKTLLNIRWPQGAITNEDLYKRCNSVKPPERAPKAGEAPWSHLTLCGRLPSSVSFKVCCYYTVRVGAHSKSLFKTIENDLAAPLPCFKNFKFNSLSTYLHKIPDRPPVSGYSCATSNSVLEWC